MSIRQVLNIIFLFSDVTSSIGSLFLLSTSLGHILDTGIKCLGAIKVGIHKVEQPSKGTFSELETVSQTWTKHASIEKHPVVHVDHPLDHFYETHH